MINNKVCKKNDYLCKSHILAKSQNSYTQIKILSFFLNMCQKLNMPAKFNEKMKKQKLL